MSKVKNLSYNGRTYLKISVIHDNSKFFVACSTKIMHHCNCKTASEHERLKYIVPEM